MSLISPDVPDEVKRALEYVDAFLMPGDPSPRHPGTQRSWQTVFTLALEDLAKVKFNPNSRRFVGWRYLIGNRSGQALYVTVSTENKMTGLSRGPGVTIALQAARELRTLPQAAIDEYEWSVLTIPGLLTESFWLKSRSKNWVVPFFTSQELRCGHPYSLEDFLKIMRPLAEDRLGGFRKLEENAESRAQIRDKRSKERRERAERRMQEEFEMRIRAEERRHMADEHHQEAQAKAVSAQQEFAKSAVRASMG